MRKIKIFITVLLMTFLMTSCDFEALLDGFGGNSFKKYIDNKEPLTSETLDEMFNQDLITEDRFSNLQIENTKVSVDDAGDKQYLYCWQQNYKVYLGVKEDSSAESFYVDLAQLEDVYDESKEQLGLKPGMSVTEIYEHIIDEYANDLGLEGTLLTERTLDELLDIFNYKYEDFTEVSEGKYEIKKEAIYLKLLKWFIDDLTIEDLKEMLFDNNIDFSVFVYFDGKNITDYEVIIENTEYEETISVKISVLYNDEEFGGIGLKVDAEEVSIDAKIEFNEEELNVNFLVDADEKIKFKLKVTTDKITSNLVVDSEEYYDADFSYSIKESGKVSQIILNGKIDMIDGITVTIESGSNVIIPSELIASEKNAGNLLDQMA